MEKNGHGRKRKCNRGLVSSRRYDIKCTKLSTANGSWTSPQLWRPYLGRGQDVTDLNRGQAGGDGHYRLVSIRWH